MNIRPCFVVLAGAAIAALCCATAAPETAYAQAAKPHTAKRQAKPAAAAAPALLAQYGDWGVYVSETPKTKICYALSQPKDRKPAGLKRDPAYFFVSTRPGENIRNEASAVVGFPLKEDSEATLDIGGAKFEFYTKSDGAWIRNAAEEARLIEAMRKGRDFTLKSTSTRSNDTIDHYSLSGVSQALDRVAQECK